MARKKPVKWAQKAFANAKGQLRATAKRHGLIKGDEPLTEEDLLWLIRHGGPLTKKRAQAALNMMRARRKK